MHLLPRLAVPLAALLLTATVPPTAGAVGWVTGPPLSAPERLASDPVTGVTPSGDRIVAWEQQTANGDSEGIAVRIAPAAGDFGPQALIPGSAGAFFPVVATGGDDNVALAWMTRDTLHIARRAPGGTSFTEATPIAVPDALNPPQLAIQGGNVYAALFTAKTVVGARTTAIRGFELPAGATAVQPIVGQAPGGAIDSATFNPTTDPVVITVDPRIALGAGQVNVIWQRVRGAVGNVHATDTVEIASRSLRGPGQIGAGTPVALLDQGNSPGNVPLAATGRGSHVDVAWARPDDIALRDVAVDNSPVQTIPAGSAFGLRAGVDEDGVLLLGWERFDPLEEVLSASVSTVPPGGPPGQAVRVSAPSSTAALPDLVVAADGTRLVLVDRHADGADNDLTGHVQGLFAAPGAPLGGLEEVSGVQDRTNFTAFNEARGALGGGRAIAVSTADDQSGVPNQRVYLAERDATPPVFDAISVPASATPGSRIALAAGATDALTPARIDWDFGDGSSASGAAATHAYGAPGSFTVTVRAHDAAGNRAVQTRTVVVAVAPGRDGAGAPPPPGPDLTAPRVTRPTTANARFRVAGGSTELIGAATKKAPAGTVFRLSVDERSTLVLSFTGKLAGRKKGSHCIAGRKTGTACSVAVAPGTLLRTSRGPGAVSIPFSGRIGGARLEPGSYRLAVSAIDAAGNRSAEQTVTFKVVSR